MKKLLLLVCILMSAQSFACDRFEAQFIGTVKSNRPVFPSLRAGCLVKLEPTFKHYAVNQLCPLYKEDLLSLVGIIYSLEACKVKPGDQVSGIAVFELGNNTAVMDELYPK